MRYYASRGNAPFGETACVIHVYHILYYKVKSKKKKCHKNAQPYRGRAAPVLGTRRVGCCKRFHARGRAELYKL